MSNRLTIPNTTAPRSKATANSCPGESQMTFRPSPLLHLPSFTASNISFPKFSTPAFFPVTRFHNLMHLSPLPTLSMSFMLGCTAKSLIPAGAAPGGAVSPLGRPWTFGRGTLIVDTTDQSLVLVTDMVLSSAPARSLEHVGKYRADILEEWWSKEPSLRFFGFSRILFPVKVGIEGNFSFT